MDSSAGREPYVLLVIHAHDWCAGTFDIQNDGLGDPFYRECAVDL
jgi:hypothetical protein